MWLLSLLLLLPLTAQAQATSDAVGPVALVSGNEYAPYADSSLPQGGMTAEIVTRALAKMGLGSSIVWQPWSRGYQETRIGNFSATFPYVRNAEREADFLYSDVIVNIRYQLYIKAGRSNTDFSKLESLAGKTYCLPLGWAQVGVLGDMIADGRIKLVRPPQMRNCMLMLSMGRVDFIAAEEHLGAAALRASGVPVGTIIAHPGTPFDNRQLHLIAPKSLASSAALLKKFNAGLAILRKSGEYDAIVKAHSR